MTWNPADKSANISLSGEQQTERKVNMSRWRPMTEHAFPWPHTRLIVVAFHRDDLSVDVLRVRVGEHGAFFPENSMLSIHEDGWVPFSWCEDDCPSRDDAKWPPLWTDYLTENQKYD